VLDDLVQVAHDAIELGGGGERQRRELPSQRLHQDYDADELLADVVVEIEAEPLALVLADDHLVLREQSELFLARPQLLERAPHRLLRRTPLGDVATDPKRYQVSFLETKPSAKIVRELEDVAADREKVVSIGREIYAWHPAGVARSKLWAKLAGKDLGVTATARNWTTVTKLLELAGAD